MYDAPSQRLLISLLLLLAISLPTAAGDPPTCYYPNGKVATTDRACNLTAEHSFCCAPNYVCLENGICVGDASIPWNRGSCTDKTWQAAECPSFCQTPSDGGTWILQCTDAADNNQICCYNANESDPRDCCKAPSLLIQLPGSVDPFNTIDAFELTATRSLLSSSTPSMLSALSAATTTSSLASLSASSSSPAQAPSLSPTSSLTTGGKVGIGIGVGLIAGLLILLAFFLRRRRQKRPAEGKAAVGQLEPHGDARYELEPSEMEQPPYELGGGSSASRYDRH